MHIRSWFNSISFGGGVCTTIERAFIQPPNLSFIINTPMMYDKRYSVTYRLASRSISCFKALGHPYSVASYLFVILVLVYLHSSVAPLNKVSNNTIIAPVVKMIHVFGLSLFLSLRHLVVVVSVIFIQIIECVLDYSFSS